MTSVKLVQILMVPPHYGRQDEIEMFAIDSDGQLWRRLSDHAGGWTGWQRDIEPRDET